MAQPATIQFDSRFEYGLQLPDGNVLWPPKPFYGTGYQTPQERQDVLQSIIAAIGNMNLPLAPTLDQYKWLKRETQVITTERDLETVPHDLDDPMVTTVEPVNAEGPPEDFTWSPESAVSVIYGGDNPTMDAIMRGERPVGGGDGDSVHDGEDWVQR